MGAQVANRAASLLHGDFSVDKNALGYMIPKL
jgi:hypothetical protein